MDNEEKRPVRLNSEKSIPSKNFKLKIGTVNKFNPEAIYFEGKTFVLPMDENGDYGDDMSQIKHIMKTSIRDSLRNSTLFQDKYILDFDIASSRMAYGKKSFLSFQILVRQRKGNIRPLREIKDGASYFIRNIVDELENGFNSHYFSLSKTKK